MAKTELIIEPDRFLTEGPLPGERISQVLSRLSADPRIGGVSSFAGLVRADETDAGRVSAIEFTAHRSMAERSIGELIERTAEGYDSPVLHVYAEHALGRVSVGEIPIIIVVGASHRPEAFGLCRDVLEALKAEVPIWGKELTDTGGHQWKVNN
ncbi:MAG: molybdenum cofactor biosynthesis protein MoaE [Spirochaetota bacterium]